jgi:serine/threonine protein kinase
MATSSAEFQLPPSETQSDGGTDGGSTIDTPPRPIPAPGDKGQLKSTFGGSPERRPASVKSGTVFGDFRIEERIGEGSMGEVYRATQISLSRTVALKLLPKEFASNQTLVERFLREMQSLAELDHPNIVRVLRTGEEGGQRYAAMEFIDGRTLQDWVTELGQLPVGDVLHIGLVCATALKHSHDRKMIHRDIKPENVLLTKNGMCKVADFGLVKMVEADMSMTVSGTGLGTPEYMAPEQTYNAGSVDGRVDIYSLGIMLYVLATGELPFKGKSIVEILSAKQRGSYQPMRAANPKTPERFDLILQKMLQAEPDRRYSTFGEVINDLASIGRQNTTLSFVPVAESDRFVAYGSWSRPRTEEPAGPTPASKSPAASSGRSDGVPSQAEKLWHVAHKNKLGKQVLSKMMTNDLIRAIENRLLPVNAQARSKPSERFRPLTEIDEFIPTFTKLGVKIRPKAPAGASPGTGQKKAKRKRRKKKSETLDLLLRIVVGLAACYGLVRGGIDVANLLRSPDTVEAAPDGEPPDPASML